MNVVQSLALLKVYESMKCDLMEGLIKMSVGRKKSKKFARKDLLIMDLPLLTPWI